MTTKIFAGHLASCCVRGNQRGNQPINYASAEAFLADWQYERERT